MTNWQKQKPPKQNKTRNPCHQIRHRPEKGRGKKCEKINIKKGKKEKKNSGKGERRTNDTLNTGDNDCEQKKVRGKKKKKRMQR